MQFTAPLSEFQKVLQRVVPAIPPKSTLPVLEHLSLELVGGNLKVVATDQEISIMTNIEVQMEEPGGVLVPARKLFDIVKALESNGEFNFISDESNYEITITTNKGKYNMKGLDPEEYLYLPELFESQKPDLKELEDPDKNKYVCLFEKGFLQRLAVKTAFAISHDEYRPAMTGALFQFRNGLVNTVATDSFRLVRAKALSDKFVFSEEFDVIVPARMMEFLKKIDDEAIMSMIESMERITHVRVDYGNTILISRIIDEKFPPYETVIPTEIRSFATVDAKALLSSLRRVSIFANQISKQIRFTFSNNSIYLLAEEEDSGNHADETIPCEFSGEMVQTAFNFKNLEELLVNIDNNETVDNLIDIRFFEINKPVLLMPKVDDERLLSLIMPVKISTTSY